MHVTAYMCYFREPICVDITLEDNFASWMDWLPALAVEREVDVQLYEVASRSRKIVKNETYRVSLEKNVLYPKQLKIEIIIRQAMRVVDCRGKDLIAVLAYNLCFWRVVKVTIRTSGLKVLPLELMSVHVARSF